jgi:hypothetical protein
MTPCGGIVQAVVSPLEHSSSKWADTDVVPGVPVSRTALRSGPLSELDESLRTDESTTSSGGIVHGPGTPSPPADLSDVTVNVVPWCKHTED